jgi:hypothetical protein
MGDGASLQAATGRATVVELQTEVRDAWKAYASDAAAALTIGLIACGLPAAICKNSEISFTVLNSKSTSEP